MAKGNDDNDGGKPVPRGRLRRLGKLAGLGARVGGELLRSRLGAPSSNNAEAAQKAALQIFETLGELKGFALKAGQTLSLIADGLPPQARDTMGRFFAQAPSLPFDTIEKALEHELGGPLAQFFSTVDPTPLASASLAQVHAAKLLSGEAVVIKVQYPGVDAALMDDLNNAAMLGSLSMLAGPLLDTQKYTEELKRELMRELDYRLELQALEQFRQLYARWPDIVVPRAHPALCTRRVLVLERLNGPTLQAAFASAPTLDASQRLRIAEQLVRAVCGPFFLAGTVHGDTHPGNFIVMPDNRLGVLDLGCVKQVSGAFQAASIELFEDLLRGQRGNLLHGLRQTGFTINLPDDKAEPLLQEMTDIAIGFLLAPYDAAKDTALKRLLAFKQHSPLTLARIKPPVEAMLVYRGLAGLAYNVRNLQINGDLRPVMHDLVRLQNVPPQP